ncbi:fasciclin domain-containing protein [Phenylobacterium sp.]|uniref:fasciclin domain-containing protein n=1 Tax=Phenylobacterium sp. TaxID=1871053 RepID=UPI0011FAB201|nr:fasciclin domain-containing protein [Phenylobacterium sp.]THD58069.1 MAG: fasciclin domain-containing protein [Phenylobacterium sp.]
MPIHRSLFAAAAVSLISSAALAQAPAAPAAPAAAAPAAGKLVPNGGLDTTLQTNANFSNFVKALTAVNLMTLLKSSPGLTVFAPTNAALTDDKLAAMSADKAALQKTLLHYIINAKIDSSKIKGAHGGVPTGAGDKIVVDGTATDGTLKADNATITQADVITSNGVIHVIDAVLVPGSVPETLPQEPAAEAAPAAPADTPAPPAPKKKK